MDVTDKVQLIAELREPYEHLLVSVGRLSAHVPGSDSYNSGQHIVTMAIDLIERQRRYFDKLGTKFSALSEELDAAKETIKQLSEPAPTIPIAPASAGAGEEF